VPTLWTNTDGSPRDNDAQLQQVWFPGVHCDVGGSYSECQLSNITLRWMIDNAKSCGLSFDLEAVERCLSPKPFMPSGPAHDEWRLIPWGIPKHRTVPPNAVLANTVRLRSRSAQGYKSEALDLPIESYQQMIVIPEDEL
jgi:hypothetical protein